MATVKGREPLVSELARFVVEASFSDLSGEALLQLKIRVLDSLGCALGALGAELMTKLREHAYEQGGDGRTSCSLIGGGWSSVEHAAFFNSALIRYLDFNDSYLARGETCHPSDNFGGVLAAAEFSDLSGRDLLLGLAIAYQIQCRLSDEAPVRSRGFDHTTQGSYAAAAAISRMLLMNREQTANAVAIAGTAYNALRVTRTGALSNWKGLAYPNTVFGAMHACFLARSGITGPLEVFEGNKGFMDSIAGRFKLDWKKEDLERVRRTIVKKYDAEIHSQSALEGLLELRAQHRFDPYDIVSLDLDIFDVAFHIIGGGEEGDKTRIETKEEADHSLPYLLAVAVLDGEVTPAQFSPERILKKDVQGLLQRIRVRPSSEFSRRFPEEMRCAIRIQLHDGRILRAEKSDYQGFFTRPPDWAMATKKFRLLASAVNPAIQDRMIAAVEDLERVRIADFVALLRDLKQPSPLPLKGKRGEP